MSVFGQFRYIVADLDANGSGTQPSQIVEVGWIRFSTGATSNKSATVTFRTAFSAAPIVVATYGGDNVSGTTTYGSGSVANKATLGCWATSITSSQFVCRIQTNDATSWGASDTVFAQYIAIGPA